MAKIYLVCSGKGGVGKSTLTVCLSRALCRRGKRVLLVDCDKGFRTLDLLTGLGGEAVYDWRDVLLARCAPQDAVLKTPDGALGLLVPPADPDSEPAAEDFFAMLSSLLPEYDFCFLDAPAGASEWVRSLARGADTALLVATPDAVSVRAAAHTAQCICDGENAPETRLLINRFDADAAKDGECFSADRVVSETYVRLLGAVPEDAHLAKFAAGKKPARQTEAAFDRIAGRLLGEEIPFREKKIKSILF